MFFQELKDKIWELLNGWKGKHLSHAGKIVLLQSVAQALPVHVMNCFLLPKGFLHEIDMLFANF